MALWGEAVDQVGGAVHRVQNPAGPAPVQAGVILLLSHELNLGGQIAQALLQGLLHEKIDIGDIVRRGTVKSYAQIRLQTLAE